ncbi:MAG: beta-lactamase family protein [Pleurocapsa minor GSE-CHR-MK-17-07R]|jgi:CubicO group peptidase (beta-lactamase class C family)|nr:beta-lactamase family protein [Pleurocapsa minor GSE-CHR-MK 17-07R]
MIVLLRSVCVLFLVLVLGNSAVAQTAPDSTDFTPVLTQIIEEELGAQGAPGAAVAVVFQGEVIFSEGIGVRSTETGDPVTPDTLFMFGSTLKPLTSIGLLRLVESGAVSLDAPVSRYLPELALPETLLVHHLLSHTGGLSDAASTDGPRNPADLRASMTRFNEAALFAPPGELHSYSNPGFDIIGAVIESASGQYYADYMARAVFGAMGMQRATFDPNVAITYPVAVGHQPGLLGNSPVRRNSSHTTEAPSGLAYASVNDLTHLIDFVLNDGVVNGETVLNPALAQAMWTPADVRIVSPMQYGLGFFIDDYRGTPRVGHGGNVDGYTALLQTLPAYELGVVVLANSSGFDGGPIFDAVVEQLLDLPAVSEEPAVPLAVDPNEYSGIYEVRDLDGQPAFTVMMTAEGDQLLAQITGQPPLELRATATDTFDITFGGTSTGQQMAFLRDESGAIAYLHAGGRAATRLSD